ncbi:pyridoxamine 5'-phosphate oxidase family protein [Mesohalobacter halotolerans]|jgi:pyridoxine/pyridoxamine 5'-phosphate oxidase|uniref:Pyridoxamine 5'-phosphate oxidase n=1 Tax=Mesohalobacter halotolerans TaxID=1883405 RepID=A0A4U5TQC6_9FLAO|nr:pyridoxamine 5'-phosphate oxidase family protein [Mesohalobacter halotolerans]MBS3739071.1 pyridoxamine 5'-phosphate oxidase family protein [Psychroflexus sp.]NBC58454.1 pyridoxamine 5'-phosphate oxidase [Bacteroidota bacterium]TKS56410.1 pyridoxamine 5'-phosphate oxidase [Mesohalobacter halotolerans]
MLKTIFNDTINEIKFGYLKRKHANKYCSLASIYQNKPQIRTVVLRDMTEGYHLIFFTDKRSEKVKQYKNNRNAEVLFYNHKKLLQIKVGGPIELLQDTERINYYKQKVQGSSKKDYTTLKKPSTPIKNPDRVDYGDELNFAVLELQTEYIESLQLKRPNHIRCLFEKKDNWKGQFLVP